VVPLASTLVSLLVILVVLFLVFKIVHVVLKAVVIVGLLLLVIIGLVGFLSYSNGVTLQNSFVNGTNSFLLVNKDYVITGFTLMNSEPKFIRNNQLWDLSQNYSKDPNNLPKILNSSYVFAFKMSAFNSSITVDNFELPYSEVKKLFVSNTPIKDLSNYIADKKDIDSKFVMAKLNSSFNDSTLKAYLFSEEVDSSAKNPMFFFNAYKKGDLEVYPKTILFRVLNYVPESFLKSLTSKVADKLER